MRSTWLLLFAAPMLAAGACVEDVGPCNDAKRGLDTVLAGGQVVYAGQAILNQACASGCHNAGAEGKARHGVPKGLDFDLRPLSDDDSVGTRENDDGVQLLRIDPRALSALQQRRTRVFQLRDSIWQQVNDGLMPPSGLFQELLGSIYASRESEPCKRGRALSKLGGPNAREVLRSWLACGAPIVEAVGSEVGAPEAIGSVGYQYPLCDAVELNLEGMLAGPLATCSACHPALWPPDFSSPEAARASVIQNEDIVCNDKPFVTPGDPDASYLFDLVASDEPGCHARMPQGGPYLGARELDQVAAWIRAGAP